MTQDQTATINKMNKGYLPLNSLLAAVAPAELVVVAVEVVPEPEPVEPVELVGPADVELEP